MNYSRLISIVSINLCFLFTTNITGAALFIHENQVNISDSTKIDKVKKSLDEYFSSKELGVIKENNKTVFRLFAPSAKNVWLVTFRKVDEESGRTFEMKKDDDGVWERILEGPADYKFYGYKVSHNPKDDISKLPLCVDPYAKAVASYTTYNNPRKSIIFEDNYNWENDTWIQQDWRDLIIYEMHLRDMTAHESSGAKHPGTYKGLVEKNIKGGLEYLKQLGVNTVELLPAMEFGNCEIPFMDSLDGKFNTWNPYERNHWGYMTSSFFAPSSYYSMNWKQLEWNKWMGENVSQVRDFKDMVKAFHKEGIAVLMDVVYNHLSEYETGNLKQIDKEYYFRLDNKKNFIAQSGCGNDLKTERPMVRRLIVESLIYWMKEYHVDGFRFDLGKLIDWETVEEIIRETRKVNPNVVIVCEPWGGGYEPSGFSLREWGSWNDQIRNGIKGENPFNGLGWIFGKWYSNNNIDRIKSYVNGTLINYKYGLFQKKEHSVNYLESHDGYTLGDFIRIGTGDVKADSVIADVEKNAMLDEQQLKLNKLASLFLFTSQGIAMIHSGQEFARSKVIPKYLDVADRHKGMIDHNSYEKDNETNYINYDQAGLNSDLLNYYKGLIALRKNNEAFRHAAPEQITFYNITDNEFAIAYAVEHENEKYIVVMNANPTMSEEIVLPEGNWDVLVNEKSAGIDKLGSVTGTITLSPVTGMVLQKQQ